MTGRTCELCDDRPAVTQWSSYWVCAPCGFAWSDRYDTNGQPAEARGLRWRIYSHGQGAL